MQQLRMLVVAWVTLLSGCSESSSVAPNDKGGTNQIPSAPAGVVVSNPHNGASLSRTLNSTSARASASDIVYISAAARTFAETDSVGISNRTRSTPIVWARTIEGGFDPVAIFGEADDELVLTQILSSGDAVTTNTRIPRRRPPTVVRTNPAHGRVDVALNVQIIIVFSEPMKPSTLNSSTISLTRGTERIEGTIRVADDGLSAELALSSTLDPGTQYQLTITGNVSDVDGDALGESAVIAFTTDDGRPVMSASTDFELFAINERGIALGRSLSGGILSSVLVTIDAGSGKPVSITTLASGGFALNQFGVITGATSVSESYQGASIGSQHAIKLVGGFITDLGTLPGHNSSYGLAINDSDMIIGHSAIYIGDIEGSTMDERAAAWVDGKVIDLGFLDGASSSFANGLNNLGQVVGESGNHAFLWEKGAMHPLTGGVLNEPNVTGSRATAINDKGQIAGDIGLTTNSGYWRSYIWERGEARLLEMPADCGGTEVRDIDELGRVVGRALGCRGSYLERAILWIDAKAIELPVPGSSASVPVGTPLGLSHANGINSEGQIVGVAYPPGGGIPPFKGAVWKLTQ